MIVLKQGLKLASGVKSQISRFRHPLLLYNNEVLSPVYLSKCFSNSYIFCQDRHHDSGNQLGGNYWNNLKKSNLHTSSSNNVYDHADNQRREKREANILLTTITIFIAIIAYVYSKVDFDEYDRPGEKEKL